MMPMDWAWLARALLQVIGLSIALAVLGFAYEETIRKRLPLLDVLVHARRLVWLAVGTILLATGIVFSGAGWLQKGSAIGLAIGLTWLSCIKHGAYNDGKDTDLA